MTICSAFSRTIRNEGAYLGKGFVLRLEVTGSSKTRTLRKSSIGWTGAPQSVEGDLTIAFRDLDYAYDAFSGATTLKNALAARLFTTHGPNDKGVAVTYLFTVILKAFFGWRASYRR